MTLPLAIAVDGGNSKTDLALVRADGDVLALARGPLGSPHHIGVEGCVRVLGTLLDEALGEAGMPDAAADPVADLAELLVAGVDFPAEEHALEEAVAARGWAGDVHVGNDTFAVLRAGTERGWGVAVVCGAGINCVGVDPHGRHARFPALGAISGDWGGGYDVGLAAVAAAARSEDGRGPHTSLERTVPAHFGLDTPGELSEAIHRGLIPIRRVLELPPIVFAEAVADPVAAEIVDRVATEIAALARAALRRLELDRQPVEVLLGGGLLRAGDGRILAGVEAELRSAAPEATVRTTTSAPIVGAALLALDRLGAGVEAQRRARRELGAAVERTEAREYAEAD